MSALTILRPRLGAVLDRRHELDVIVLRSPPGFGKSVLLEQAVADGPPRSIDRDVRYRCVPSDAEPGALVTSLLDALGIEPLDAPDEQVDQLVRGLSDFPGHTALVLDDLHLAGPEGVSLTRELLGRRAPRLHLVVSTRGEERLESATQLAAGTAVVLDAHDLAFTADELAELTALLGGFAPDDEIGTWPALAALALTGHAHAIGDYLDEAVLADLDPGLRSCLAAITLVGGATNETVAAVVEACAPGSDPARVTSALGRLPLVQSGTEGVWPHDVWSTSALIDSDAIDTTTVRTAAARERSRTGADVEAATLAFASHDPDTIAEVLCTALAVQPPRVDPATLREWAGELGWIAPLSGRLTGTRLWLEGVLAATYSDAISMARDRLEAARAEFARDGDIEAEIGVILHLGVLARQNDDLAAIGALLTRARELSDEGVESATALVALGDAVVAQMAGNHDEAVGIIDAVPLASLRGDWEAQARMIRGTNLAFGGHFAAGIAELEAATGIGSGWSRAVATDLVSAARWADGAITAALEDADEAVHLAETEGSPAQGDLARAARACEWGLVGDPRAVDELALLEARRPGHPETAALVEVGRAIVAAADADPEAARKALVLLDPPVRRPLRSSRWRVALEWALDPDGEASWRDEIEANPAFAESIAAGRAGAAFLTRGPAAPVRFRPLLPSAWCEPTTEAPRLRLVGGADVHRGHRPVEHPAWGRGRVRELCLRLAVDIGGGRAAVATDLWPDLDDDAAARNLRVNLTHVLDVLAPERSRGQSSPYLEDRPGLLRLADDVRIDIRDVRADARRIHEGAARNEPATALAAARHLLGHGAGPLLGGEPIGEWAEPVRRDLVETVSRAVARAGELAMAAGEHDLAEQLGRRGLAADPWSESAHRLVVSALLLRGDRDGARRAARDLLDALTAIDVEPSGSTVELLHRCGIRDVPQRRST